MLWALSCSLTSLQMRTRFTVDDQRHYLFSPRHLSEWVFGLLRYDMSNGDVIVPWCYEARRLFRDILVCFLSPFESSRCDCGQVESDIEKFDALLSNIVRTDWNLTPGSCAVWLMLPKVSASDRSGRQVLCDVRRPRRGRRKSSALVFHRLTLRRLVLLCQWAAQT